MKTSEIACEGYEKVVRCDDPESGLRAIISVHDTTLGPALGGTRMWPYLSDQEALTDVNRLSQGMTYKSAVAETGLGGGKAVIIGNPKTDKSEALFKAMGRFVDTLGGLYTTAEDVGTNVDDMVIVRRETKHVTGLPREMGSSGDPSPFTAIGVFLGIQACVERLGGHDLKGIRVAVQGCGNVARFLISHLAGAGADLIVTDIVQDKVKLMTAKHGATSVSPEEIYDVECDVFCPCALGAVINDDTVPRLNCKIVAGGANNVLLTEEHGDRLRERSILYAPDFVINAGGIINVSVELEPDGYNEDRAMEKVRNIHNAVRDILETADHEDVAANRAAILLAERKLEEGRQRKAPAPS
ncbi:MAG: Glu/Leu/Phe/Val dehydrogenase dimerization domain-containing protein [Planctomycetota bacterium]|jgi:leucine dehydrogenase